MPAFLRGFLSDDNYDDEDDEDLPTPPPSPPSRAPPFPPCLPPHPPPKICLVSYSMQCVIMILLLTDPV